MLLMLIKGLTPLGWFYTAAADEQQQNVNIRLRWSRKLPIFPTFLQIFDSSGVIQHVFFNPRLALSPDAHQTFYNEETSDGLPGNKQQTILS